MIQRVCFVFLALIQVGHGTGTQVRQRVSVEDEQPVANHEPRKLLESEAPLPGTGIGRIRGGETVETPFSWLGVFNDTILCGCVLVHNDIVLTTANCVDEEGFPEAVRIGSTQRDTGGTVARIKGGMMHPDWTGDPTMGADLALLHLDTFLTNTVAIVNSDPMVPKFGDEFLFMAGFGLVSDTEYPNMLQGVELKNVENCFDRAGTVYNPVFHFCGNATPTAGTCPGDSGTPILIPGTRLAVGLNSFSDRPCEMQTIDVYTRLSSYSNWIQRGICDLSAQPPAVCEELDGDICLWESIFNAVTKFFGL